MNVRIPTSDTVARHPFKIPQELRRENGHQGLFGPDRPTTLQHFIIGQTSREACSPV